MAALKSRIRSTLTKRWTEQWGNPRDNKGLPNVEAPGRALRRLEDTLSVRILDKYRSLDKAESSVLIQARTGHIGLNGYLHQRKVPGADQPYCAHCLTEGEIDKENVDHVLLHCPLAC